MFQISEATNLSSNLGELLQTIHNILGTLLDTTNFYIALYDQNSDRYSFPYFVDQYDEANIAPPQLKKSLTDYVRRTGRPLLVDETLHRQLEEKGEVELVGTPSPIWLGVPLKTAHGVVGVVVVQNYTDAKAYSEKDLDLMTFVSGHIAMAIERKQAEQELVASRRRTELILNTAGEGIYGLDLNGNTTFINPAAAWMIGWQMEELIGKVQHAVLHHSRPDGTPYPREECPIYAALKDGSVHHRDDEVFWRKDGSSFPVEYISTPIRDEQGELRGAVITFRDITERRRAEEALRESAATLAEAQRMSHVGSWDWDVVKNQAFCSDEYYRIFGVSLGRFGWSFDKFLNCVHPEDRQRVKQAHGDALAGKKHYNTEYRIIRPDGSERIISAQGEVRVDEAGQPTRMVGTVHDITERKRAEEALRQSEAEYRSLIQGAAYGIYRSTTEGKFLDVNPALVAMLGYDSEAELLAANLATEIYWDSAEHAHAIAQHLERWDGLEVEWKRKDGTPITVRLSGRVVRDAQGAMAYFEGIAENITEQRLLEAQLRQSQKMEAVGRLAGGVAHDFNNLLMVMRGYTELLLGRLGANDPLRRNVEEIQKAADRATSLTQQLLAFSRKQVMQPKVFDLNAVVSDTEKMLRRLIGEDIELATLFGADLGRVKADPGQIEQVILNLAVNARDAMPQGGKLVLETANVELTQAFARQHPGVTPGPHVMLAMSDTGVGMDAETQARIFEPFFTTKEKGKGTGLGLATVYGIVKQSGGYIWVYSEAGQGTTFEIYLPRVEDAVTADQEEQVASQSPSGSETVLVVEDEAPVRKLAREFLENSGYTVLEAEDPVEAIKLSDRHQGPIHLMVTDVVMPKMSGHELAQQMASVRPEMKVLYVSGYTDDALGQYGVLTQDSFFLQKPFSLDTLARKMRTLLEGNTKTSKKETLT